jgi:glycosyltransferase involved in cell wall biosynthesis
MPGLRVGLEAIAAGSGLEEGAGGARGYYEGVLAPLAGDQRVEELVTYVPAWLDAGAVWRPAKSRLVRCQVPKGRPLRVAYEHLGLTLRATRDHLDVLFSTGNYRPLTYTGVNVVGLQAIQHFILRDDVGRFRGAYMDFAVPRSVRSADMTIASSETLRHDAIRLWNLDPERIVGVPLGPPPWIAEMISSDAASKVEPHRLPDGAPYVMCISRLYALKNHRRLIEAFARLVKDGHVSHKLLIVGGDADVTAAELAAVAAEQGVSDCVRLLGRVPQKQVPGLYAGASAIAYVSLYETFGHPVLEAFAMGRPLLTSNAGATAETAGGAALLADPLDVEAIAAGLREILFDEELRARLSAAGAKRVRDFSWERYAKGSMDAIERALELRRSVGRPRRHSRVGQRAPQCS